MFKKYFTAIVLLLVLISFLLNASDEGTKARMRLDLDVIRATFDTQYAPIEWKTAYAGWDINQEVEIAKSKVNAIPNITTKQYQQILKQFFDSLGDYHVAISFYSTELATLPFKMKSAEGHYFLTSVDRKSLPINANRIIAGDELISMDGIPMEEVMQAFLAQEFHGSSRPTDKAFAEMVFTSRLGSLGYQVPQGPVTLTIKHKKDNSLVNYTLNWYYEPEQISSISLPPPGKMMVKAKALASHQITLPLNSHPLFKKSMLSPYYKELLKPSIIAAGDTLGGRESFVPTLGKKVWEASVQTQFYAYIFETEDNKRVGYIRIPHYTGGNLQITQFRNVINKFQNETSALVIDQVNNPGGSMFYMYTLISMLSDKPLAIPQHRITITQKEISNALEIIPILESISSDDEAKQIIGENLDGLPVNLELNKKLITYFYEIISQWNGGYSFTKPLALYGLDTIEPHVDTNYTKPILVLVNQLDISCGDFFPAILQDNQRAKIFGSRTAGAGGFVLATEYPNLFGVQSYTYTGSIAQRVDSNPIESLGVTPDISYELQVEDLRNHYQPYVEKVNQAIRELE